MKKLNPILDLRLLKWAVGTGSGSQTMLELQYLAKDHRLCVDDVMNELHSVDVELYEQVFDLIN